MSRNYKIGLIFPTIIHEYEFDKFDNNDLIKFCYEQKDKDPIGQKLSNRGGWHSKDFSIGKDENIISTILSEGLGKSVFTSIISPLKVGVTYWIMINSPNTYNTSHTHPEAHLSGVMWIKTQNKCGDIEFDNPADFTGFTEVKNYIDEVKEKTCTYLSYSFYPKQGKMLTFPSALRHKVLLNKSNEDRIAVSYNIRFT